MKTDSIQQLLKRYEESTLSDSELVELNRLTHRDEVMQQAERQANGIIHRRRTIAYTLTGLLVAGAATWTLLTPRNSESTLIAEATVPEVVISIPEPVVEQMAPAAQPQPPVATPRPTKAVHKTAKSSDEPVVVCNNQCEADSVISDIWKFLTV